jgi:predicted  nucleic acid-binding Zn-ribbon protein
MTEHEPAIQNEPIEQMAKRSYTLASPEFFHLLHRIEQTEQKLGQKIEQTEQKLEQKIAQVEQKLEQKISQAEQGLGQRIDQLDQKIAQLNQKLDQNFNGLSKWIMATLLTVGIAVVSVLVGHIL